MKPFDIPYNFDTNLIDFLQIYQSSININSIYIAPFRYHYQSAKYYYSQIPLTTIRDIKEYERHIQYIQNYFPNKLMLLLQQTNGLLSNDLLKYYIKLNISKFCVGSIEQAEQIKAILPQAEIIGSITMKIDNNKLEKNIYNLFNGFVLWFPFNRDISAIKKLPKNFNYHLLINCTCHTCCQGTAHWLAKTEQEEKLALLNCPQNKDKSFQNIIFIPKTDLKLFEPYISCFKLQGREYQTNKIIADIVYYTSEDYSSYLPLNYNIYNIYNIK